ncbi:MAG: type II CRISPR RNA-guided endonuclease Cas9 [Alphaproteobacteria bacterium]
MKYRLSLDLGVSSIGAAIISLNKNNEAENIIDAGVRIFNVSEGAEDRRTKRTARKNNERTKKRLEILAKKLYENGFWESEKPTGSKKMQILSPYAIRAHAVNEKLNNPNELGRALLHIAKHRGAGFVDVLKIDDEEDLLEDEGENKKTKKNKKLSSYENLAKHLRDNGAKTVGEYFYMRLKPSYKHNNLDEKNHKRVVRQRADYVGDNKSVDYAIPRYLVKDEFNQIWNKQKEYYTKLQDEKFKQEIYDILFYELPAAPYATANCIYVDSEKRLLKAHPLSEKRRVYEAINNIKITTDTTKRSLTIKEQEKIINELAFKGKNINKTSVRTTLGFDKKFDIVFADNEKGIKPYLYSKEEFQKVLANFDEDKLTNLIEFMAEPKIPNDKQGRLYREDDLISELKKRLQTNDEKQIAEILSKLPSGRGTLGITATTKILELLKNNVISHREAADLLVKSGDIRFKSEEILAQETQGKYHTLPYYGEILRKDTQPIHPWQLQRNKTLNDSEKRYGKIANPAVHMMLNQLRFVVNDIIRIYSKPYEINIELGRDVGMSAKKKKLYEIEQKKNEKFNEEAVDYLKKFKIRINKENILKYKLAKEQSWKDAFNPQKRIEPRFTGFEIEHLIPQAKGGTDTFSNLALVDRNDNLGKGDLYPYEYFEQNKKTEEIRDILINIRNNSNISDGKKWRFEPDARESFETGGDADETNRYLTDTRYMAKLSARYLRAILDFEKDKEKDVVNTRVLTIKGSHTAKLRTAWNLDGLEYDLMKLDIPRYCGTKIDQETGEVSDVENKEWLKKPRIDHRHHAIDAITLGCINRNFIQEMNWSEKRGFFIKPSAYPLPLCHLDKENYKASRAEFRNNVLSLLKNIKVSHKPEHSKAGELHKEKGKTILKLDEKYKDLTITKYSRKILDVVKKEADLSKILIDSAIKDEWYEEIKKDRKKLEDLTHNFKKYFNEAKNVLTERNENLKIEGKKVKDISENMILVETFKIIKNNNLWKGEKFPTYTNEKSLIIIDKHQMAYTSGNNHRADFYEKDGKVECEVINNFDINRKTFTPIINQKDIKSIWSIFQGDLIEIDTPDSWRIFINKEKCIAEVRSFRHGRNQISLILANDARNSEKKETKPSYMLPVFLKDLSANSLVKIKAKKIELTPFGKIKKKHKALKNGKNKEK